MNKQDWIFILGMYAMVAGGLPAKGYCLKYRGILTFTAMLAAIAVFILLT